MFNKKLIFIFCLIFLIGIVSAETINLGDYVTTIDQDECFNIPFGCDNCTYVNLSISSPDGTILIQNEEMTSGDGFLYNYSFCNTSEVGRYWVTFHYDEDGRYLYSDTIWYDVTPNGTTLKEGNAILYIGSLILMLFLLIISIVGIFTIDNYIGKFTFYWVSHVLFVVWTFSVWKITNGFLIGFVGLAGIFKILFWVSIVSMFPMLILSLAWTFYIHTMNDHFKRLLDKGEDVETAFSLTERKSKRDKFKW